MHELSAVCVNEASLCSASIGPASHNVDRLNEAGHNSAHTNLVCLPVGSHEVEPLIELQPATLHSSVSPRTNGSLPVIHLSQASPIMMYGGNLDNV